MPVVDTRQDERMVKPFTRAGWELRALSAGDYAFHDASGNLVLIEDKTVSALLADMASGKLSKQARKLVEEARFPILLIRGHWTTSSDGRINGSNYTWHQVWNYLETLQDQGLRLQLCGNDQQAIERIFELQEYYSKAAHSSATRGLSEDKRVAVLSMIPGISEAKAKAVLAMKASLVDIANATVDELSQAEGVGNKLAREIYDFWRGG